MSITAAMIVYNEENRIENILQCVQWCDKIVIGDRKSTDATKEIAEKYSAKVFTIPSKEYNPSDNLILLNNIETEWMLSLTASDVMTPGFAKLIKDLILKKDFPYDVIHVPFRRYVLGLETKRSPWYSEINPLVYRKSVVRVDPKSVHGAIYFETNRHYKMKNSNEDCIYHLTHEKIDMMMDRHLNYWRAEARTFPEDESLYKAAKPIISALGKVILKRKTFLLGWDGIALAISYMCYSMLRFVYIWESKCGVASKRYSQINQSIKDAWAKQ